MTLERTSIYTLVVALAVSGIGVLNAQSPEIRWTLDDALKQIDRQAGDFKTALARIEVVRTDRDGNEVRSGTGTGFVNEDGEIRYNIDDPDGRVLLLTSRDVYIYTHDRALVEQYSLSKHKSRLEPYVRLGFSTTGKHLKDDYIVTSLGEHDIGESRALGLELTPKKEKAREIVAEIELWIDQASWMPTRHVISDTQSGDTLTVTYTHMARNLKLKPELFKTSWPRGTQKIKR